MKRSLTSVSGWLGATVTTTRMAELLSIGAPDNFMKTNILIALLFALAAALCTPCFGQAPAHRGSVEQQQTDSVRYKIPPATRQDDVNTDGWENVTVHNVGIKEPPFNDKASGVYIPPGGHSVSGEKGGMINTQVFDMEGHQISSCVTTIGANPSAVRKLIDDAQAKESLGYIVKGARQHGVDTSKWSSSASNPTNNFNRPEFWLSTEVFEGYIDGVMGTAYEQNGMKYEPIFEPSTNQVSTTSEPTAH